MTEEIRAAFHKAADKEIATQQSAYMKNKFSFYGLKSPIRKEIQRPFLLKSNIPSKEKAFKMVKELWGLPQRELHYFAMELLYKYKKDFVKEDLEFFEYLIQKNSWWDSIDFIAPKILGEYFQSFPEMRKEIIDRWIASGNIWLQRSAILFQLKYKSRMDEELLRYVINQLKSENEFFIRKAIGWVLREYSKVNPSWVEDFVNSIDLQPLSQKEAMKVILKRKDH